MAYSPTQAPMLAELFVIKSADGTRTYLEMPKQAVEVRGLAFPPNQHRTVRAPFQHGESYLGFSLRPRPVQIALHLRACDRMNLWLDRRAFLQVMNPLIGRMRFQVHFRDGTIFELHNVSYDAGFDVGTDGQPAPQVQQVAFRLMAWDPVWFEHPEESSTLTLVVVEELVFRIRGEGEGVGVIFPITFGTATELIFDIYTP